MKRLVKILAAAAVASAVAFSFWSCKPNDDDDEDAKLMLAAAINNNLAIMQQLQQQAAQNNGPTGGDLPVFNAADLTGKTISQDIALANAGEVKNLDLGGHSLTVRANGVVMSGVKNGKIVIGKELGEGDFTIKDSSIDEFSVEGGGSNSIHISSVTLKKLLAKKENVRVVLEGATQINEAVVSTAKMLLETAEDSTATVAELKTDEKVEEISIKNTKVEVATVVSNGSGEAAKAVKIVLEGATEIKQAVVAAAKVALETVENSAAKIAELKTESNVEEVKIANTKVEVATVASNGSGEAAKAVKIVLEGATEIKQAVVAAAKVALETAENCKAKIENLKAESSVESIEMVNSTIENTEIICSDSETEMRDVISAINSSVTNIIPKKEDGTVKEEFVPKLEILNPVEGKKGLRVRVSNWHPKGTEISVFLFPKDKKWVWEENKQPYVGTIPISDNMLGYGTYDYEWVEPGKEYAVGVQVQRKGELGSGNQIIYATADIEFTPATGRGEYSFLDANGQECVVTLDKEGTFHWVTRPAFYPGRIEEGVKISYSLFSDKGNWLWLGQNIKSLEGLTEEEAYADFTIDTSGFRFENIADNTIFGQIQIYDGNGNLIYEVVNSTNDVVYTDAELQALKDSSKIIELSSDGIIKFVKTRNLPDLSKPGSYVRYEVIPTDRWKQLQQVSAYPENGVVSDIRLYDFDSSELEDGKFVIIAQYHGENGDYVGELGRSENLTYSNYNLPKKSELSSTGLLKLNSDFSPDLSKPGSCVRYEIHPTDSWESLEDFSISSSEIYERGVQIYDFDASALSNGKFRVYVKYCDGNDNWIDFGFSDTYVYSDYNLPKRFELSSTGLLKINRNLAPDLSKKGSYVRYEIHPADRWDGLGMSVAYSVDDFVNGVQLYDFDSSVLSDGKFKVAVDYHGEKGEWIDSVTVIENLKYSNYVLPRGDELSPTGLFKLSRGHIPAELMKDSENLIDRADCYLWYGITYKKADGSDGYTGTNVTSLSYQFGKSDFEGIDAVSDDMKINVHLKYDGCDVWVATVKFKQSELRLPKKLELTSTGLLKISSAFIPAEYLKDDENLKDEYHFWYGIKYIKDDGNDGYAGCDGKKLSYQYVESDFENAVSSDDNMEIHLHLYNDNVENSDQFLATLKFKRSEITLPSGQ